MKPEDLRYEDFKWKKGMLYLDKEFVRVSYRQDMDNSDLYWLMTDRGESEYSYNKSRVKDNGVKIALEDMRKGTVHKGIRRALVRLNSSMAR